MFRKCSLDVPNIAGFREQTANIPGILRAAWEETSIKISIDSQDKKSHKIEKLVIYIVIKYIEYIFA